MSWSHDPHFEAGTRGNVGALNRGEWFEGVASLSQWRGLIANAGRAAPILKAMDRLKDPPALHLPWFENTFALARSLRKLGGAPGAERILGWMLRHPQVHAYVHSVLDKPYPDFESVGDPEKTSQPMCWVVSAQSPVVLSTLLEKASEWGASWACLTSTRTRRGVGHEVGPLPHAARIGWVDGARLLIDAGATSEDGVLTVAGQSRQVDMVRFLLERGADVHHRDADGQTVLGRIGRHIRSQGSLSALSSVMIEEWLKIAALIAAEGGRFDIHDGKSARADTVSEIWTKAVGPEYAHRIQEIMNAQALDKALRAELPDAQARPRHRL